MSMSSYSSSCSSSSSSSSSSGSSSDSSSSSGSTGKFSSSSKASFSSRSTVVAPQPVVRPFGCPEYNYFWIENKSQTNPKLSYYYNYKSHHVVWQRPLPNDVPIPFYANKQAPGNQQLSEDDDEIIVSDPEDDLRKRKRLNLKRRNRRLVNEELDNSIQVLSIKKAVKTKKMLDTLWKLHRVPGETVEDIKKRLLDSSENNFKIKTEPISKDDNYSIAYCTKPHIKQEPISNDYITDVEHINQAIKTLEDDSDSDPEHVSYLIRQEYLMHYEEDSELENKSKDEEEIKKKVEEEEVNESSDGENEYDSDKDEDFQENNTVHETYYGLRSTKATKEECLLNDFDNFDDFEFSYEAPYLFADLFDIEITEDNTENICIQSIDSEDNVTKENVNWTFEKSSDAPNNSTLTELVLNPFRMPELKQISSKCLLPGKTKKKKPQKKRAPAKKKVIKTEPVIRIKSEVVNNAEDQPIICDMYGTRTINYNHPPKLKMPKWQSCSKLSGSSEDSSEDEDKTNKQPFKGFPKKSIANSTINNPTKPLGKESALELKNWFPKQKTRKRKRMISKRSDSSWCESNLSDYTDIDEFDVKLLKMKKEKTWSSEEKKEQSNSSMYDNFIESIGKIKKEPISLPFTLKKEKMEESKIKSMPMTPAIPAVDLSIVKVERSEDLEEELQNENVMVESKGNGDDGNTSGSNSSSKSCMCSRSSCSCSSSSSSSSSDEKDSMGD